MKQIINNKIYDTETAELIYEYRHSFFIQNIWLPKGYGFKDWEKVSVYKTKNNNYFKYYKYIENDFNYQDRERIEPTTLENIKEIIKELNPDKFIELFGKIDLEEA